MRMPVGITRSVLSPAGDPGEHGARGGRQAVGIERGLELAQRAGARERPLPTRGTEVVPRRVVAQLVARDRPVRARDLLDQDLVVIPRPGALAVAAGHAPSSRVMVTPRRVRQSASSWRARVTFCSNVLSRMPRAAARSTSAW